MVMAQLRPGQGQRSKVRLPETKTRWALPSPPGSNGMDMLAANNVMQQQTGPFCRCRKVISAACVGFMFGKKSSALGFRMTD